MKLRIPKRCRFPTRPFPSQDAVVTPLGEVTLFLCRKFEPIKRRTMPLLVTKTCTGDLVMNWFCFTEYYANDKTSSKTLQYPKDAKHYGAEFHRQAISALGFTPRSVTDAFAKSCRPAENAKHIVHPLKKSLRMAVLEGTPLFLGIESSPKHTSPIIFSRTEHGFTVIHYMQYTKKVGGKLDVALVRAETPEDLRRFGFDPHTVDVVASVASD